MNETELLEIIKTGEDSKKQFKLNFTNIDSLTQELVAFSNSGGGKIFIGVDDDSNIKGLQPADIKRLNQLISNAASQSVKPSINPLTENINTTHGIVIIVNVSPGLNKHYMDNNGHIWVKNGADKRRVTAREEMQRLFQESNLIYADETPILSTSISDIHFHLFSEYFNKRYKQNYEETELELIQIFRNLNLAQNNYLNLAGVMLFAKDPQKYLPVFMIKAAKFPGNDFHENKYIDSEDIHGVLERQFERSFNYITRNLHHTQNNQGVNTLGVPEIPYIVIEEFLVNALVHRDYFINAPIRIFIFNDRIEIISPGHLPNHLTPEHLKYGLSNIRNPVIMSHAVHMLPYRGLGSGIPRALKTYPHIQLIDDRSGNQFKVVIFRKK